MAEIQIPKSLKAEERSPVFQYRCGDAVKGLMPFLSELLPNNLQEKVVTICIQELVAAIEKYEIHHDWIYEFK